MGAGLGASCRPEPGTAGGGYPPGVTPTQLAELLGEPPVPHGSWERAAVYASAAALRSGRPPRAAAEELAARLRGRERIAGVRVRDDGFLMIEVACPGEIVREIVTAGPPRIAEPAEAPPDHPRTWDNPGFVVRYAHARAAAVERWADALGVPWDGFRPELLADPHDRAVLRLLAEPPSRGAGRDPRWAGYAERLALAYHDAHERAPAVPRGDEPVREVHTARLWLARAVRAVLSAVLATPLPERI